MGKELVIEIEELKVHFDAFLDAGVREALSDAVTVCLVGQLFFEFFEVVLAVGVLDVDEQLRPFSHDVISTAQQITGCAHGSGVGVGHREGASAEEGGDFFRIDSIVLAFAAMDSLHVEGMAQDEGNPEYAHT